MRCWPPGRENCSMGPAMTETGKVSLVGAGPGDPGLITVKALDRLRAADAVVYDRLVDPRLLAEAREDAELIDVGKARGSTRMKQDEINQLLVELAGAGKSVCRLKGGDPFVFGRGGEEALALARAGVPWEVVPGVTSAFAAPAYAGIPVTHRGLAASVTIVTGSEDPRKPDSQINWHALAGLDGTLVFLMGWSALPEIVERLIASGMPPDRAAALVQWGTMTRQRVVAGPLAEIAERGREAGLSAPVAFVIGDVNALRGELGWFDSRPLFGKRVLVTRTRTQASHLRTLLEAEGAECVEFPAIRVVPVADPSGIDEALARLADYDWITFSSSNGVREVRTRLDALGLDARSFAGVRVAAVGPATGETVRSLLGIRADLVPDVYVSEAVVNELGKQGVEGRRILAIRSDIGRDALATGLRELGAEVDEVVGYETRAPDDSGEQARLAFESGIDITTFTSSSGVDNLVALLDGSLDLVSQTTVACMGPITAGRAEEQGISVDVVAPERTMTALVGAIVEHIS